VIVKVMAAVVAVAQVRLAEQMGRARAAMVQSALLVGLLLPTQVAVAVAVRILSVVLAAQVAVVQADKIA
jgi:hypothetical protein